MPQYITVNPAILNDGCAVNSWFDGHEPTRLIATKKTRDVGQFGEWRRSREFARPACANSRVFPALRDFPGNRKQHNANREKD
jgi:hypothetical protein